MLEHAKRHGLKASAYLAVIGALVYAVKALSATIAALTEQIDFLTRLVDTTCK